jgi:RNA polymerase sigma factor (TIGR02999 family)
MNSHVEPEVATLLAQFRHGDTLASDKLLALLYSELHQLAKAMMHGRSAGHTLQATALVHEAYVKLAGNHEKPWNDRAHFLAVAAKAMRCVLIDHARAKMRAKRDAGIEHSRLDENAIDQIVITYEDRALDLLALDEALERLARFDPLMARAVELRFFGGLDVADVAQTLGIQRRTLERQWAATRAWLFQEIS